VSGRDEFNHSARRFVRPGGENFLFDFAPLMDDPDEPMISIAGHRGISTS
jgi:hypothetical protein